MVTITVRGKVDPAIAEGSILTNSVRAFADNLDPNAANNSDQVTTTVSTLADSAIVKRALVDPIPGWRSARLAYLW